MSNSCDDDLDRLFVLTRSAYGHLADELPAWRNHCRELMCLASTLAAAMGLEHETCSGFRRLENGNADVHHWVVVGGRVLHSPKRGVVEWADPAPFEATKRTTITP